MYSPYFVIPYPFGLGHHQSFKKMLREFLRPWVDNGTSTVAYLQQRYFGITKEGYVTITHVSVIIGCRRK